MFFFLGRRPAEDAMIQQMMTKLEEDWFWNPVSGERPGNFTLFFAGLWIDSQTAVPESDHLILFE